MGFVSQRWEWESGRVERNAQKDGMKSHTILSINKVGRDKFHYTIRSQEPGLQATSPVERVWEARVHLPAIRSLCVKIRNAVERPLKVLTDYRNCCQEITNFGQGLYDALFPKNQPGINDLRNTLRRIETPLLISTDMPDIHWELLYDAEEKASWGMKYQMGRRLRMRSVAGARPPSPHDPKCLLIAVPDPGRGERKISETVQETQNLRDWLIAKDVDCKDFLHGEQASFEAVLERLVQSEYDVIHFAGHIIKDTKSNEYALRLHGNDLLPAKLIADMVRGNPLVFLNSCWGGKAKGIANSSTSVAGLTDAFLSAGAHVVVSSLFQIPDPGSRAFAEKFYESVLNNTPAGEAMRNARRCLQPIDDKDEKEKLGYAAAWASFIMYGDPCWRLERSEMDVCQRLLKPLELCRENFDISSLRIIESAIGYGAPGGIIGTPHLFAALIDGEDEYLRTQIRRQKIAAEKLRDDLKKIFAAKSSAKSFPAEVTFSKNMQHILRGAWSRAQRAKQKISERDLLKAFIDYGGGNTGKLLKEFGVNIATLFPDADEDAFANFWPGQNAGDITIIDSEPEDVAVDNDIDRTGVLESPAEDAAGPGAEVSAVQIGPLAATDCETEVWEMLLKGAYIARQEGQAHISTVHFTKGMLLHPQSLLSRAFLAYGLPKDFLGPLLPPEEEKYAVIAFDDGAKIDCSESVFTILHYAKEFAEQRSDSLVQDRDLLAGFCYQGGGNTGAALRRMGVVLQFILSRVFHNDGRLNLSIFSPVLQKVIAEGLVCAEKLRFSLVGRGHFLFAWLNSAKSRLAGEVRKQGKDPEQLAETLFLRLPSGDQPVELKSGVRFFSPGLVRIFLAAEQEMASKDENKISEEILLPLFIADGGGEGGKVLVEQGVKFSRMLHG